MELQEQRQMQMSVTNNAVMTLAQSPKAMPPRLLHDYLKV